MTMFDPEKITFFAKTDARGQDVAFGIKAKDRQRHMYVVGKTGMGKSTLLENMAAQDIQNGEGLAFIDPHGSAAETLLEYVPEHRVKDVVYFAPFDINNPVSFNVMEDVGPDKRHLVVSGLMSTFKKIWVDAWSARMEYILTNALLVLIEYPDTTLLSVNRLFIDKNFRKQVVDYCKDPAVKSFWTEEFANYTDRFAAEALPAIQNKIGQFTGNPLIRNIIGQPKSSFDIRQIMDERKILIMNLSKGLIGETNANLLGSMLTTRIYLAAMSRADLPVEQMRQMPNFYFYVDEFQSFANATFANILSEARKYHLNLIIAHQYIAQMEEEVRDAVFGNVGTTISFRVGPFDGEVLETVFAPRFEATDLVNLGFAQIYLTLMINGIGSQPFSAVTVPPVEMPAVSCREMVIAASRKTFANERTAVEKIVDELHTPRKPEQSNQGKPHQAKGPNGPNKNAGGQGNPNHKGGAPHSQSNQPRNQGAPARPQQQNTDNRNKKPPFKEKTSEDLRAVLSKMTAENKPKNNSVPPKSENAEKNPQSKERPTQQKESTSNTKPAPHSREQKPGQKTDVRNNSQPRDQKPSPQRNHDKNPSKQNDKPAPASDLKSALADVLKQAEKQQQKTQTSTPEQKESAPAPKPSAQSSQTNQIFAARRVGFEVAPARPQAQATPQEPQAPKPAEQPQTPPAPTAPQAPKVPQASQSDSSTIDTQKIKKMLRHNDQERTPFQ